MSNQVELNLMGVDILFTFDVIEGSKQTWDDPVDDDELEIIDYECPNNQVHIDVLDYIVDRCDEQITNELFESLE